MSNDSANQNRTTYDAVTKRREELLRSLIFVDSQVSQAEISRRLGKMKSVSGYLPKITLDQAREAFLKQMSYRTTCDDKFKADFINECNKGAITLEYFPVVTLQMKATHASWTSLVGDTTTTGYHVTITGNDVSGYTGQLHEDTRTDYSFETINQDLNYSLSQQKADERINNLAESDIVQIEIPDLGRVDEERIGQIKWSIRYGLESDLKKELHEHCQIPRRASVTMQEDDVSVFYYPMYQIRVNGLCSYVNGIDGTAVLDYEKNAEYADTLKLMKKKDVVPGIFAAIALAGTVAWMIYTMVRVILLEVAAIELPDPSLYEGSADFGIGWAAIIGGNILVGLIWIAYIGIRIWYIVTDGLYAHAYKEWEKENRDTDTFAINASAILHYIRLVVMTIIYGAGLIILYMLISSIFVTGGIDVVFGTLF